MRMSAAAKRVFGKVGAGGRFWCVFPFWFLMSYTVREKQHFFFLFLFLLFLLNEILLNLLDFSHGTGARVYPVPG
mgnify:CR=1 FL=1